MGPTAIGASRNYSFAPEEPDHATEGEPGQLECRADESGTDATERDPQVHPPTAPTDNNARRTRARDSLEPYADAGYTESGDGVFAGIAALKTHGEETGVEAEVFSASVQLGAQNEIQAGLGRIGGTFHGEGFDVSLAGEALTSRLNVGIHNEDDSTGANLGVMATGAGFEITGSLGGWQVTAGLSASMGVAVSSGDRNIDGDSTPERCFKGSIGALTLGFCSEL
jgi:hypothetical protein